MTVLVLVTLLALGSLALTALPAAAHTVRKARARESREEGETRWRANADTVREARARESREEGETQRRANAEAVREARARRIEFRKYCCSRPKVHTKVAEASEASDATYTIQTHSYCAHRFTDRLKCLQSLRVHSCVLMLNNICSEW